MYAPINPGNDSTLDWPNVDDIIKAQTYTKERPARPCKKSDSIFRNTDDVIWIPSTYTLLKLRILIAAHTGQGGHRRWKIEAYFSWNKMSDDVQAFLAPVFTVCVPKLGKLYRDL